MTGHGLDITPSDFPTIHFSYFFSDFFFFCQWDFVINILCTHIFIDGAIVPEAGFPEMGPRVKGYVCFAWEQLWGLLFAASS